MSSPDLPPELLDYIVDLLRDSKGTLKACCLVSKSWVPHTRKHLFASVELCSPMRLQAWKNAFPNPSTSPACYAKSLSIGYLGTVTYEDTQEGGWILTFSCVQRLEVDIDNQISFITPFHGFSPAIKSLHIKSSPFPFSRILNLIYSFPLLEDLSLDAFYGFIYGDDFHDQLAATRPSSSPALTGTLKLLNCAGMHRIASALQSLPNGLHFRKLDLTLGNKGDISSTMALVDECSCTLESLRIHYGFTAEPPEIIDLSKATKLRDVTFGCSFNPRWVTTALRTVGCNHRSFQQFSVCATVIDGSDLASIEPTVGKAGYSAWLELDRFLAQLHELRSIRPKVNFRDRDRQTARGCAEFFLPKAMTGGIVDLEDYHVL